MTVDVVVIAGADGGAVGETLRWLGHQTMTDWRALVAPASVPEPAAEAVRAFNKTAGAARATLVAVGSGGRAAAWNAGAAAVTGAYAVFLDAGDKLLRRGLERLVAAARGGGYDAACGGVSVERDGERQGPAMWPPQGQFGLPELLDGFAPPSCGVLVERAALTGKRLGGNMASWGELDLWLRLSEGGARWRSTESVVALRPARPLEPAGSWSEIAAEAERVVQRSFRRASANGWDEADLSEERERAAVVRWSAIVASMAAIMETDERLASATEAMRERATPGCITPGLAAATAVAALHRCGASALPVVNGTAERRWAPSIQRWWSRCVSERWADRGLADAALPLLAAMLTPEEAVAATLLDRLGLPARLVVTGAGPTAFAVGDAAAMKGWNVAITPFGGGRAAEALVAASGERFSVTSAEGASDGREPLVIGLEHEPEAMERFAGRPNVMRYSAAARELAAQTLIKLRAAWPRRGED